MLKRFVTLLHRWGRTPARGSLSDCAREWTDRRRRGPVAGGGRQGPDVPRDVHPGGRARAGADDARDAAHVPGPAADPADSLLPGTGAGRSEDLAHRRSRADRPPGVFERLLSTGARVASDVPARQAGRSVRHQRRRCRRVGRIDRHGAEPARHLALVDVPPQLPVASDRCRSDGRAPRCSDRT